MAVKIRLARRGRKKRAIYDVVVADVRAPRDGRFIEKLGSFNPNHEPPIVDINVDSALKWVMNGAIPTDTARRLLSQKGVMLKKHLQVGVNKGAITQEEADKRYDAWLNNKEGEIQKAADQLAKAQEADKKAKLDAEAKVNAARAEEIAKKQKVEEEEAAAAEAEASAEETVEAPAEEAQAEAPAEEPQAEAAEEAPAADAKEEAPAAEAKEEAPAAEEAKEEKSAEDAGKEEEKAAE